MERPFNDVTRGEQPYQGEDLIQQWLEFQRETLLMKCQGLDKDQLATRSTPPSTLSLARILRHLADMERFDSQILRGLPLQGRYDKGETAEPAGETEDSDDFVIYDVDDDALAAWQEECAGMRTAVAGYSSIDDHVPSPFSALTVRSILLALTMEYARHNGHADFLRESLDGSVGY